ncbi:hypothetical protein AAFF_G00385200 [Aldrovandia affinis]|uniref:Protein FAM131C n=1 Tax=Aldrovandia affinis TaxID=143900 RepID=A0AAD7SET8_9TELE|nr:hypothetical protein AAFF_G00385200 [Aldrovandia affinis]
MLTSVYRCTVQSILTYCHTVCTASDRKSLQRVVKVTQRVIRRANSIIHDPTHPNQGLLTPVAFPDCFDWGGPSTASSPWEPASAKVIKNTSRAPPSHQCRYCSHALRFVACEKTGGGHPPSGMAFSDKRRESGYGIGELATSSLLGLVATIKEHITKPTAMAQGRVAHLIEWKGWDSGRGAGCSWRREGCAWAGAGMELQEDEQLYPHLAEEIIEARFAAGVAEQFALAEAAMYAWAPQEQPDEPNGTYAPLQDPDEPFLSRLTLDGVRVPQHPHSINQGIGQDSSPLPLPLPTPYCPSSSPWQPDTQRPLQKKRTLPPDTSIRQADSGSLSEDDVFYN